MAGIFCLILGTGPFGYLVLVEGLPIVPNDIVVLFIAPTYLPGAVGMALFIFQMFVGGPEFVKRDIPRMLGFMKSVIEDPVQKEDQKLEE